MDRIESKEQLIEFIKSGEKKPNQFKIGTEHEKFAFDIHDMLVFDGDLIESVRRQQQNGINVR